MYDTLIQYINKLINVSHNDLGQIISYFTPISVPRNEILINTGDIGDRLYFVTKGSLRTYYTNRYGIEITRFIAFEGGFITTLSSFMTQEPSIETLEALEKSEILVIKHSDFYKLLETNVVWEKLYRSVLENKHILDTRHLKNISTHDFKTRYYYLNIEEPYLFTRLEDRIIASYMGLSLEDFAAFKNK